MTMKLEISPELEDGLLTQAQLHGMSLEAYADSVLRERVQAATESDSSNQPFWKTFTSRVHALPDEVFERLPKDGASEHDHYIYGTPKRNA